MVTRRSRSVAFVIAAMGLLAGCGLLPAATPELVRDNAGYFSPGAEAIAEARLRTEWEEHGILLFIVTAEGGDPPRIMAEPMTDAGDRPAMAVIVTDGLANSTGLSEALVDRVEVFSAPDVSHHLEDGEGDAALDILVRAASAWAATQSP